MKADEIIIDLKEEPGRLIQEHEVSAQALITLHDSVQNMPNEQKTALQVFYIFYYAVFVFVCYISYISLIFDLFKIPHNIKQRIRVEESHKQFLILLNVVRSKKNTMNFV